MSAGTSVSSAAATDGMVGGDEDRLAHVGNVEQAGGAARLRVLGDDAGRILHRHVVAGERHHAGAESHVGWRGAASQRRVPGAGSAILAPTTGCTSGRMSGRAPSVAEPERFRGSLGTMPTHPLTPFGEPACSRSRAAFQSFVPPRSGCLRVSGAVAPSAPALASRTLPRGSSDGGTLDGACEPRQPAIWRRAEARYRRLRSTSRRRSRGPHAATSGYVCDQRVEVRFSQVG